MTQVNLGMSYVMARCNEQHKCNHELAAWPVRQSSDVQWKAKHTDIWMQFGSTTQLARRERQQRNDDGQPTNRLARSPVRFAKKTNRNTVPTDLL